MIRLPNCPPLLVSDLFNATTSLINCGLRPEQAVVAQTTISACFPAGSGELGANTIWSLTPSASNVGPRFYLGDNTAQPGIEFNGHSSGTNEKPGRASALSTVTYSAWNFVVATWDGSLTATNIRFYGAVGSADVAELAYLSNGIDGTGTALGGVGNNLVLGNRGDAGRTFNGQIAYIARFRGVMTLQEIAIVRRRGPLVFRDRMLLCWANGRDYGPYGVRHTIRTAVTLRAPPNIYFPLGPLPSRRIFVPAPAGGGFNAAWNIAANTVIHPGAVTA